MSSISTKPPSGTRDFLPADVRRRAWVVSRIRTAYEQHGFDPLETPTFERLDVLTGKYGEEGDQLLFRILKRRDALPALTPETPVDDLTDLGLRYDLTVPLARVVANYQAQLPRYFRRYQIQPVWRADRPQKGRFREFFQCDVDFTGTTSEVAEHSVISAVTDALAGLGFHDFTIRLNDRRVLAGLMEVAAVPSHQQVAVLTVIDKIDKIGVEGVTGELEALGLSADAISALHPALLDPAALAEVTDADGAQAVSQRRLDALAAAFTASPSSKGSETGADGVATLRALLSLVQSAPIAAGRVLLDPSLARGLSYYTGPIFEIAVAGLGGSMGGGGRYDGLVGMFRGQPVPAVGFSLGLERLLVVMEERQMFPPLPHAPDVLIARFDEASTTFALGAARVLRQAGLRVEVYPDLHKVGRQLQFADERGTPWVALCGERESRDGKLSLKHLASGNQEVVTPEEAAQRIQAATSIDSEPGR